MNRPTTLIAGSLVLALATPQALGSVAAAASPTADPSATTTTARADRGAAADRGLGRLRADAAGQLRVHRTADGAVDSVSSRNGRAMVGARGTSTPRRSAAEQLARYGETFGIDGSLSQAVVSQTSPSTTGGSVVRAEQVVDGVPVFGGQVVLSLDQSGGVVSVTAATTEGAQVPEPVVGESIARQGALAYVAKQHRVPSGKLTATDRGRHLYDPAVVHTFDPLGPRPVWEFEVSDGLDIRETVLVGTGRGEIALHFNDAPGLERVVCDNAEDDSLLSDQFVPACLAPARAEGDAPVSQQDVNAAYDNLGATAETYQTVGGRDLTALIGTGTPKALMATVRWCYADEECPYANAFWDGQQMVFGTGYAGADDVVGHELTHGYVERTSALFALHQSGALNESLADTIGEVVDHRNNPAGPEDNTQWQLGEDVPGGALRSMKDPTLRDQPDRMTSPDYVTADLDYDAGAVHENDGVGNKTAYLISQGGTFNGQTVQGIDAGDAGLLKTGRLYLEVIPRLTSGSEYADLGRVLVSTCEELAATATAGFTSGDCTSVRSAVLATELDRAPADPGAAAPEAALACPAGYGDLQQELRDDDATRDFPVTFGSLWQRTPDRDTPSWAHSGSSSWFGWNPDPDSFGDPPESSATAGGFVVPTGRATVLSFHHAYAFEFAPADAMFPAEYYDGGQVLVQAQNGDGSWTTQPSLAWTNGPTRTISTSPTKAFAGDSHGYGSSLVDLTPLAGRTVRVQFKVLGDDTGSVLGWFVDDLRLSTCTSRVPTGTTLSSVRTSGDAVTLTWTPATFAGSGVSGYQVVTGSGAVLRTLPATARSATLTRLNPRASVVLAVRPVNQYGEAGPGAAVTIRPSSVVATTSVTRARKNRPFTVLGRVRVAGAAVAGMPVVLQKRLASSSTWTTAGTGTTSSAGTKAWAVRQAKSTYYRVVARGVRTFFGSTSPARLVAKR